MTGRIDGRFPLVEAEHDEVIPHQVIDSYAGAPGNARSMTRRLIHVADQGFRDKAAQRRYTEVLMPWMTEMVVGSRESIADDKVRACRQERRSAGAG